jgi:acyl transferase domain-containing protein
MDALCPDLLDALQEIRSREARIPIYSTVTGEVSDGAGLDAAYWVRNLREPVLFSTAVQRALADVHHAFVEISPHPILLPSIQQVLRHVGSDGTALGSLRREAPQRA